MLVDKIRLEPGEAVLVQTRRHWFLPVSQIASVTTLAVLPLLSLLFLDETIAQQLSPNIALSNFIPELVFGYCLILVFYWVIVFSIWTNYYLDVLTITDRRAILINQKGFFWRNVASFRLERMQDMRVEVNGLIATMLDYGTIHVETAGHSEEEFRVDHIPTPSDIKSIILQAADNRIPTTSNHDGLEN